MVARPLLLDLPEELVSERLIVRPYRPGDGAALFEAVKESYDRLAPWMPWVDGHQSVDDSEEVARRLQANYLLRTDLTMGMWRRTSDGIPSSVVPPSPAPPPSIGLREEMGPEYLGGTGLHRMDWEAGEFEIGYWIRTSAEGAGYVQEAVHLLTSFAFERLDAQRILIKCAPTNERSKRVAERAGFILVPSDPSKTCPGSDKPSTVFEKTRAQWEAA